MDIDKGSKSIESLKKKMIFWVLQGVLQSLAPSTQQEQDIAQSRDSSYTPHHNDKKAIKPSKAYR